MTSTRFSRRNVLGASVGASIGTQVAATAADKQTGRGVTRSGKDEREIYELRTYHLRIGAQAKIVGDFLADVFIPAANRLGVERVGVFSTTFGPEAPGLSVLLPHKSFAAYARVQDELLPALAAQKTPAARAYLDAPSASPAFVRIETQLLRAFSSVPKLLPPPKNDRIFELRVYENPGELSHEKKVSMFSPELGELDIFRRVGLEPVFFGQGLAGPRLPSLTYMLVFPDIAGRQAAWDRFRKDPAWLKLKATEGYSDADIMANITSLILAPTPYSQI